MQLETWSLHSLAAAEENANKELVMDEIDISTWLKKENDWIMHLLLRCAKYLLAANFYDSLLACDEHKKHEHNWFPGTTFY